MVPKTNPETVKAVVDSRARFFIKIVGGRCVAVKPGCEGMNRSLANAEAFCIASLRMTQIFHPKGLWLDIKNFVG
ncbi:hypothetical protein IQ244_23030 [Nostoc sp. LEGE 06077]|nr:hypothetical protein [Nostoc sp. LEGE 06077]